MSSYLKSLEAELNDSLIQCRTCGTNRIKINFINLPDEQKQEFKDSKDDDEYYLHCPACDTYSAIGATHFSPAFEPKQQMKLKAAPARNAPCPCGSGKQYKRCHGK